jgi:hypothetical protein
VAFNGTNATFTFKSANQITAIVPAAATTGAVTVTTPGGTGNGPTFTVETSVPAPTVASLNPVSGGVGTSVTITGTNFAKASAVSFNGVPATSFTVDSATQITVPVPAGATTGAVSVTTPSGTATGPTFTMNPPVVVAIAVTPSTANVSAGGTQTFTATVTGNANTTVTWTTSAGTITSAGVFTAPATAQTVTITATSVADTTKSASATVTVTSVPPPVTVSISGTPTAILVGGTQTFTATVTGSTNQAVTWTAIGGTITSAGLFTATTVGTATVTATSQADVTKSATVNVTVNPAISVSISPATASVQVGGTITFTANIAVTWTASAGTITSAGVFTAPTTAQTVTIIATSVIDSTKNATVAVPVTPLPPTITGLSPTSAHIGDSVDITGTDFTGASAVSFNGTYAAFNPKSSTLITATVPAGATTGNVSVTTPSGTSNGQAFTVIPPGMPTLTAINWPSANVGVDVILTGTYLTGTTSLSFHGTPAIAFTVNSATQITVTVPVGATAGAITATTPIGTATGPVFTVTTDPAPVVNTPGPLTDYYALLVNGSNILNESRVYLGNVFIGVMKNSWTGNTGNYIYNLPIGIPGGLIKVMGPNGTGISPTPVTINVPLPTFSGLTPVTGPIGTVVTVTGTNLQYIATVNFNGVPSVPLTRTATQATVYVPAAATSGTVSVTNPSGTVTGPSFTVTAAPAPTLTVISPTLGQVGDTVTLTGSYLFGASAVMFNGTLATTYTVVSPTQITVTVPEGATTGPVSVTTPSGTAIGPNFTPVPKEMMPRINDFNPSEGGNWATIYITGVNLQGTTNVDIAGKGNYSWTVVDDNLIKAQVYWDKVGDVTGPITVTTPNGPIVSPRDFTIKGYAAPFDMGVTSFSPNHGKPFDQVQINGTAMDTVTSVYFGDCNGMMQATIVSATATTLTVTLPGRLVSGKVCLFTPHNIWGCYTTSQIFTADSIAANPIPVIDSFTPDHSDKNWTMISVRGSHFTGATKVGIGGSGPGDFFYVLDDNHLQIHTPMWAQTGPITVTTPAGTGTSTQNFRGPYLPGFWTLSPDNHAKEGDVYRLNIAWGPNVQAITIGGVPATFSQVDTYRLDVTIPVGALSGYISLTNTDPTTGNTNSAWSYDNFFIAPTLTGMSPATGTVGTPVTISGRNFQDTTNVTFGGVSATSFKILSGSLIQAVVPQGAVSGPIAFVNRLGDGGATASSFTVVNPVTGPVVADIVPATAAVGDKILLTGTRLTGATAVSLGGANATFTVLSDTSILVTVPAGATTGVAHVATPSGSINSYGAFTPQATRVVDLMLNGDFESGEIHWPGGYGIGPLITSSLAMPAFNILPQSGTWTQTVGGWGWGAPSQGATRTIDAPIADAVAIPADATKVELRFRVGLVTEENTGTAKDFLNVKLIDALTGNLLPNGQVLQLNNLTGSDHVMTPYVVDITAFKGRSIQVKMESDEDKEMKTAWTMDDVQLLVYGSTSTVPTMANVFPTAGYPEETVVTLNGSNLKGIQKILFNGVPAASWNQMDSNTVEVKAPFGCSTGQIVIVTGMGATALPGTFTVNYHQPQANHIEPSQGPIGTPIAILGQYLRGTTSVTIHGVPMVFHADSDAQISTTIPVGATTGTIQITGLGGTASAGTFTVTTGPNMADLYIDRVEFIQVTQREDGSVPMVKDRQALARVHVKSNMTNALKPSVKLSLFQGSTKVYETVITTPTALSGTPLSTTTADFDKTWNATIAAQYMQPGVSVLAQVNPDGSQTEVDPTNNVWPYDGTPYALDVRDTQQFKLTMVPLSMVVDGVTYTGDVNTNNLPTWTDMFSGVWPLPDNKDVQVHAIYNAQHIPLPDYSSGWMEILAELKALRLAEVGNTRYYYGALGAWWAHKLGGGSGMADSLGVLQAMGIDHEYGGTKSPYTWRQGTLAHELGHALSRPHTPCGNAGSPDNNYPYDNGVIGSWGYGFGTNGNQDGGVTNINIWDASKYHDIMGYCGFEWVSDYCYNNVMDYRLNHDKSTGHGPIGSNDPTVAAGVSTNGMQDCLMVWGHVQNGEVKLYPSFVIKAIPSEQDPEATYQAEVVTASGAAMGRVSFEPGEPDHGPRIHGFNVLMPLSQPANAKGQSLTGAPVNADISAIRIHRNGEKLAEQTRTTGKAVSSAIAGAIADETATAVRLANGKVRFTWDSTTHPMVMIRNEKGEVITFAQHGTMDLVTDAKVFDVHYSDDPTSTGRSITVR